MKLPEINPRRKLKVESINRVRKDNRSMPMEYADSCNQTPTAKSRNSKNKYFGNTMHMMRPWETENEIQDMQDLDNIEVNNLI